MRYKAPQSAAHPHVIPDICDISIRAEVVAWPALYSAADRLGVDSSRR
jgi:hypothetical protein